MRKLRFTCLAMAVVWGVSAAWGQESQPDNHILWFQLLQNSGVAKELKLSEEQTIQVEGVAAHFRKKHKEDFEKLKKLEGKEKEEKTREVRRAVAGEANKAITKANVLTPEQDKRLKQILWQQQGPRALLSAEVQQALKFSDEQKDTVKVIFEDAAKKMREIQNKGKLDEEGKKKLAAAQKDTLEKTQTLLTEEQKKAWKELKGEPFEVHLERQTAP